MHRFSLLAAFLLLCLSVSAAPISRSDAAIAGTNYLQANGLMKSTDTLSFYTTYSVGNIDCFYVFNLHNEGFVLVSADDRCTPILGYSFNGSFVTEKLPINTASWLNGYRDEISRGVLANAPDNPENAQLWKDLLNGKYTAPASKSNDYLLTSTWDQGSGYNNYCPTMNGEHVVVGCVATAMAQIIRYWQYPTRGFGRHSYNHTAYGVLAVDFDTTEYNYNRMPDHLSWNSPSSQKDMVSRLCYHCGIVVNMEYQHAGHTSGSGAQTEDVVEAIAHFGYTDAQSLRRDVVNNDAQWMSIIRNEIDNRRPIEYSGFSNDYGHAFVLDGYNNSNKFHFNWGWNGYSDGFYTLTTMQGFVNNNLMVINIVPSGWDGHLTTFLVSPDGNGDGTSWQNANSNIHSAVLLNKLSRRNIWMKEGTYYGDTTADYAYTFAGTASIYGGFAGNETELNQRDLSLHHTVIDGLNRHGLLSISGTSSSNTSLAINDITLQNGYSRNGNCVFVSGENARLDNVIVQNCISDSGNIIYANNSRIRYSDIAGNKAPIICNLSNGSLRQSIVNNNEGNAISLNSHSNVINCDIVSNIGTGAVLNDNKNSFVNNILWNNDTSFKILANLPDTSIRYCAYESDTALSDSTCIRLNSDNIADDGPRFINPSTTRGVDGISNESNWRLGWRSICIDRGENLSLSKSDGDKDKSLRCRNRIVDLGCYESNYPVSIPQMNENSDISIRITPNPAHNFVNIELGRSTHSSTVIVFDALGHEVINQTTDNNNLTLDVTHLSQGIYFVKCGNCVSKLVVR